MPGPRSGQRFLHLAGDVGLGGVELGVHAAGLHQLLVGAGFGDEAVGDGDDPARRPDGTEPVGDDEGGSTLGQGIEGLLDLGFGDGVRIDGLRGRYSCDPRT